jgi:hypothetical protein
MSSGCTFARLARVNGSFRRKEVVGIMHHGFDIADLVRWLEARRIRGCSDTGPT